MKRKARLKDIAEALNISTTTVSRALNNKDDISEKTKNAVLEVAKLLNYRPNYFAKSLHHSESHFIGAIVPRVNHSFYAQMIDGILSEAEANGFVVLLAESMDKNENEKRCIEEFLNINIAGLIIAPAYDSDILKGTEIDGIDRQNVVVCDRSSTEVSYNQVTNDHVDGAYQATKHLINQGYYKVGHIRGLANDMIADDIYHGYAQAMSEHNLVQLCYQLSVVDPVESHKAMNALCQNEQLEAVLTVSDEAALGVYRYCYEQNLRIPDDMAVVGYSNAKFAQYLTPSLSTVDQKSRQIGINAIELLTMNTDQTYKTDIKTFSSSLIIRESSNKTNYDPSHKS